ncbi:MAG: hypothetical protein KAT70_03185 [Thermoplasmata archaeon]|nr:hypothetical protein [Thermoplasmata archaeon]
MEIRVVNTRATFLTTPKIGKPKDGKGKFWPPKRLVPGGNNLPSAHVAALDALDTERGSGKVWAMWGRLGYVKVLGGQEGRQEVQKPEGPKAPPSLLDRTPEAAEAMAAVEEDPTVLRAWYAQDRREGVRASVLARLTALGASLED